MVGFVFHVKMWFNEFVSALDPGSSSPGPSPGQSHSAVLLSEIHYSYSIPPIWEQGQGVGGVR